MSFSNVSRNFKALADPAAKLAIVLFLTSGIKQKLSTIVDLLASSTTEPAQRYAQLCAEVSALVFILLLIAMTVRRYRPVRAADGVEAWLSAMAGTFLAGTLVLLPRANNPPSIIVIAVLMSAVGGLLSAYVLLWLGRSFSITAQARRLVTSGPYAIVRHPLYLAEELMVLGMLLLVMSPLALAVAAVHWAFQLRRMTHEESVLQAAYQDYASYAARTPRLIPMNPFRRSPA